QTVSKGAARSHGTCQARRCSVAHAAARGNRGQEAQTKTMSLHIPAALAALVRRRARGVCEYCRLPQRSQEANFHVDHIDPRAGGGRMVLENLALACVTCSLKKAARTYARDPASGE